MAALCNLDGPVPDLVTWVAVNALLGLPTDTPPEVFRPLEATPDPLASCAGTYASAEGLCLRLTYRDSTLGAELDGNEVPCAPLSVDRVLVGGVPVRFLRRGTKVWAAAIGGRIVRRTG